MLMRPDLQAAANTRSVQVRTLLRACECVILVCEMHRYQIRWATDCDVSRYALLRCYSYVGLCTLTYCLLFVFCKWLYLIACLCGKPLSKRHEHTQVLLNVVIHASSILPQRDLGKQQMECLTHGTLTMNMFYAGNDGYGTFAFWQVIQKTQTTSTMLL